MTLRTTLLSLAVISTGCGGDDHGDAAYSVAGSVAGLTDVLVLTDGAEQLTLSADGDFAFAAPVAEGAAFAIRIVTQPRGQSCSIVGGRGTATTDVHAEVRCFGATTLRARASIAAVDLAWEDSAASSFDVYYAPAGSCTIVEAADLADCAGAVAITDASSPRTVRGLMNGVNYAFWLVAHHDDGHGTIADSGAHPGAAVVGGMGISAVATDAAHRVYLGGAIDAVGPDTGGAIPLRRDTAGSFPYPAVHGTVNAVVSDGEGGWFVGGSFDRVGDEPHHDLAHILADASVAPGDAQCDDEILALARDGATLYVGGRFTHIGGAARSRLAAIDTSSGAPTTWAPAVDDSVNVLALDGTTLFAGGAFTSVGGHPAAHLAAFDTHGDGAALDWAASVDGQAFGLALGGGQVYASGVFTTANGTPRKGLAAFDAGTGQLATWNPAPDATVLAIVVTADSVYVAGAFTQIGGATRTALAALSPTDGTALPWTAPSSVAYARALAVHDGALLVAGDISGDHLVALDLATAAPLAWAPELAGAPRAFAVDATTVYAGFDHTAAAFERTRVGFVAFEADGSLSELRADSGTVLALAVRGDKVYLGGAFDSAGGQPRKNLAELDTSLGTITSFAPNPSAAVRALVAGGSYLYAGGDFNVIGGVARNFVAQLDPAAPSPVTAWDGQGTSEVDALALDGTALYVGGNFIYLGGGDRSYLGALDTTKTSGNLLPFAPGANGPVRALAVRDGVVYAGGTFSTFGGAATPFLAAASTDGSALSWKPAPDAAVNALAVTDAAVYAGGEFTTLGGQSRAALGAVSVAASGPAQATAWTPDLADVYSVRGVTVDQDVLHVVGDFARGYAALPR